MHKSVGSYFCPNMCIRCYLFFSGVCVVLAVGGISKCLVLFVLLGKLLWGCNWLGYCVLLFSCYLCLYDMILCVVVCRCFCVFCEFFVIFCIGW